MSHICPKCGTHTSQAPGFNPLLGWTPQDVEAETLAGYYPSWPSNPRLDAWNCAVSLGGKDYEAWRKANIEPMQQRLGCHTLWRGQITKLLKYEERMRQ